MTEQLTAAVFGESLVDVIDSPTGTRARPGGSPLNVAVGLARLGADVEFATSFGIDEHGRAIDAHLRAAGVRITDGSMTGAPTSIADATIDADGHADYAFEISWAPAVAPLRPAAVAHVGSIGALLEPGCRDVRAWVESVHEHSLVSFDPNIRPAITGVDAAVVTRIDELAGAADIVKISAEDVAALGANPDEIVGRWLARGCSVVIITDGDRGVRVSHGGGDLVVPAVHARVVDTVGAGDSFMAGLLWSLGVSGLLDRDRLRAADLSELARHAAFAAGCAAVTVGREGADPPSWREVSEFSVVPYPS